MLYFKLHKMNLFYTKHNINFLNLHKYLQNNIYLSKKYIMKYKIICKNTLSIFSLFYFHIQIFNILFSLNFNLHLPKFSIYDIHILYNLIYIL